MINSDPPGSLAASPHIKGRVFLGLVLRFALTTMYAINRRTTLTMDMQSLFVCIVLALALGVAAVVAYEQGYLDPVIETLGYAAVDTCSHSMSLLMPVVLQFLLTRLDSVYVFKAKAKAEEKKLEAEGLKAGDDFLQSGCPSSRPMASLSLVICGGSANLQRPARWVEAGWGCAARHRLNRLAQEERLDRVKGRNWEGFEGLIGRRERPQGTREVEGNQERKKIQKSG